MSAPLRLVLAGAGHSQVEVLRQFAMKPPDDVSLTLISRDALAPYSGMLPGFIAGHYAYDECHVDVRTLASMARARLCLAEVTGIDLANRRILLSNRPSIDFDLLSLNVGSRPASDDVPGAREFAWPAKPVDEFIRRWQRLVADLEERPRPHRVLVVGAGAGGVELTMAMHHRLSGVCSESQFALVSATPHILPSFPASVRSRVERALATRRIGVHPAETAASVTPREVLCASGLRIPYDTLVWTTQASPLPWLRESGLATDDRGFVLVDESLRSLSHQCVFAAGDVASLSKNPRPKSGVFAVREGPYLANNVRLAALRRPLLPYHPQRDHLSLISTGGRHAIASRGAWSTQGAWVWRWKDRIDRKWIDRYRYVMPGMIESSGMGGDMKCAGCGAKLGPEVLGRALARLDTPRRPDVLVGLEAPDDAAVIQTPPGTLTVHSVDFFPPLVDDAFLAGRIAAVHCLSDLYAMGAAPHTALAIAGLPEGSEAETEDELVDLLAGARSVLDAEGAALVGGHTVQGEGRLFGLSVNGLIDRERHLARRAPEIGDVLILTKPLGVGAIFAADMRGLAQNDWLADAIAVMTQSNAAAARILYDRGAAACTDVTGFGLAGHLLRALRQAGLAATLELSAIPIIAGALAASARGIASSLYPANATAERELRATTAAQQSAAYPLLFDPQTAGGLIAALPPSRAADCIGALHASGYAGARTVGLIRASENGEPRLSVE